MLSFLQSPLVLALLIILGLFSSCNKKGDDPDPSGGNKTMEELIVNRNFDWATTMEVSFTIITRDNMDNPLGNVRIKVYSASPDSGGVYMFGGVTDASGVWTSTQPVPSYMKSILVENDYVGLI